MEQDNISQKLKHFNISPAHDDAKERSIMNAVSAFESEKVKKNAQISQGSPEKERLISKVGRYINKTGDIIMKKTLITSGVVAACAAVFVMSQSTFLTSPWHDIELNENEKSQLETSLENRTISPEIREEVQKEGIAVEQEIVNNSTTQDHNQSQHFDATAPHAGTKNLQATPQAPARADYGKSTASTLAPMVLNDDSQTSEVKKTAPMVQLERSLTTLQSKQENLFVDDFTANHITERRAHDAVSPNIVYPIPSEPNAYQHEKYEHFVQNHVKQVSKEPVSTFSADVDTTSYSIVRKSITSGYFPQADAVRVEEMINYFNYDYDVPKDKLKPFKPTVAVYPTPWNEHTKLMHIGIKGYEVDQSEKPQSNLVFLIDVSGSMHSANKLPLLKKSFNMLLGSLNPDDTVSIVVYAGAAGTVLEPTRVRDKSKIISALSQLRAGGSTAGAAGIKQAYHLAQQNYVEGGVNRVILATDGDFNVGINNPNQLKQFIATKRDTGIFLSVLGFGSGNYNDHIMQSLAQNGNGNAAYIDSLQEAQKLLVDEANSTLFTIAKDVKFQVEFNPNQISEYRLIGYETRHLNREDFNNDKIDAGDIGSGHTVTAIYEITPKGAPTLVDPLRYGSKTDKPAESTALSNTELSGEYAFLKLRYKLPDEDKSTLITRPITDEDVTDNINTASNDIRFAASVAAFGQLIKSNPLVQNGYSLEDVITLANNAKGSDDMGYRNEFVKIVRIAKSLHDGGQVIPSYHR